MQTYRLLAMGSAMISLLSGCVSPTPHLDSHFGESVDMALAQQTINLQASKNTDPVAGIDGMSGQAAMDRYHESFKSPPSTANILTIDVLGGGGGSK